MSLLVTGGAGMIGSIVVRQLLELEEEVIVVDDLSSGRRSSVPKGVEFVQLDISAPEQARRALSSKPTTVIHLAALFANQNSIDHPERDLQVNGLGTLNLLRASLDAGVDLFVYTSSSCVYGGAVGPLHESMAPGPHESPYSVTKWLGEEYVRLWHERFGLDYLVFRPFNAYGPWDFPGRYRSVIPNFLLAALKDEPLTITGSGHETRDFTYAEDTAAAIVRSSLNPRVRNLTLNIGTGNAVEIASVAERIVEVTGSRSEIVRVERRGWDGTDHRRADVSELRSALGWVPSTSLDIGIAKTCEWFTRHVQY